MSDGGGVIVGVLEPIEPTIIDKLDSMSKRDAIAEAKRQIKIALKARGTYETHLMRGYDVSFARCFAIESNNFLRWVKTLQEIEAEEDEHE